MFSSRINLHLTANIWKLLNRCEEEQLAIHFCGTSNQWVANTIDVICPSTSANDETTPSRPPGICRRSPAP
jgi:hypothetical protein